VFINNIIIIKAARCKSAGLYVLSRSFFLYYLSLILLYLLSVRILRTAYTNFRVYVYMTTPPKPLDRFA